VKGKHLQGSTERKGPTEREREGESSRGERELTIYNSRERECVCELTRDQIVQGLKSSKDKIDNKNTVHTKTDRKSTKSTTYPQFHLLVDRQLTREFALIHPRIGHVSNGCVHTYRISNAQPSIESDGVHVCIHGQQRLIPIQ
jgi:hypothetical protein